MMDFMQIEEAKEDVLGYFAKKELPEGARERIMQKCKKWIIATWVTSFPGFIVLYPIL